MIDISNKKILDATCGSRSIWFNKNHPAAVYCDKREEEFELAFGKARTSVRKIVVNPDIVCDFTDLPFEDSTFSLVIFDPPHLIRAKETAWLVKKYGKLDDNWKQMIHDGFCECMRVLKADGVLVFKWSEHDIPSADVESDWPKAFVWPSFREKKHNILGMFYEDRGNRTRAVQRW